MVQIEGVGNSTGQVYYCYPETPDYATAAYVAGLVEPPPPVSGQWDMVRDTVSTGRFRVTLDNRYGPVDWAIVRPLPINEIREHITDVETIIDTAKTNTVAGISAGDVLYGERESFKVSTAVGGLTRIETIGGRGYAGSTAVEHDINMDLYNVPPALVGREVIVYETPRTGGADTDEVEVYRGIISTEVASGIHSWFTFECVTNWRTALLNQKPVAYRCLPRSSPDGFKVVLYASVDAVGLPVYYFGNDSGSYYWVKLSGIDAVLEFQLGDVWESESTTSVWGSFDTSGVQDYDVLAWGSAGSGHGWGAAYPILYSAGNYPSFGFTPSGGAYEDSDNPIIIALNLLTSLDGTNFDTHNYDKGAYEGTGAANGGLYPNFALGVDKDLIDYAAFEEAYRGRCHGIHADRFWLGGPEPESMESILFRLFAPLGYVCGTRRDGTWTLLKIGDVYPGESSTTVDHIINPTDIRHKTMSRALDWIEIQADPGPDGQHTLTVIVDEEDGRVFYPEHVGQRLNIANAPYSSASYDTADSIQVGLLSAKIHRLAMRVAIVEFSVGPEFYGDLDLGDKISIYDPAIRNPETGEYLEAGEYVYGLVASISGDAFNRTERVVAWIQSISDDLGLMSPSADVVSYDAPTKTFTVTQHAYSRSTDPEGDGEKFVADDHIVLVDSHGVIKSGYTIAGGNMSTVQSSTATTVVVDQLLTEAGGAVTVNAGDVLVYTYYDEVDAQQIGTYAYDADGGDRTTAAPSLGAAGDDPNIYGG
jgi:hypothetical protein